MKEEIPKVEVKGNKTQSQLEGSLNPCLLKHKKRMGREDNSPVQSSEELCDEDTT